MAGKRLTAAERRKTIVDAGRSVFLDVGLEGSRTITIAKLAGINEAMIYQHFPSKYAIFEESVLVPLRLGLVDLAERVEALAGRALPADDTAGELEQMWIATMGEIGPLLGTALLSDRGNGQATYRNTVVPVLKRIDAVVASVIRDPQTRSSWTITRALFGANLLLGLQSRLEDGAGRTTDDLARQVSGILINGMSTP